MAPAHGSRGHAHSDPSAFRRRLRAARGECWLGRLHHRAALLRWRLRTAAALVRGGCPGASGGPQRWHGIRPHVVAEPASPLASRVRLAVGSRHARRRRSIDPDCVCPRPREGSQPSLLGDLPRLDGPEGSAATRRSRPATQLLELAAYSGRRRARHAGAHRGTDCARLVGVDSLA